MCGIAGILSAAGTRGPCLARLRRILGVLRHRGPDGHGMYVDDRAALGHVRLSIIDARGGGQPLCNEDGSIWITFNGEVFNYLELRETLIRLGHRFATRSDTETIVHAYEQWGDGAWERFNGQFAVALWDAREQRLTLARDRVGIAPLHYARVASPEGERIVFASEAKAIFAEGSLTPELEAEGLWQTFALWSSPAPTTVWRGVVSLEPGEIVTFNRELWVEKRKFWSLAFEPKSEAACGDDLETATDHLGERLLSAVRLRLRSDVPVGAYLSGGLDSSVIASLARREHGGSFGTFSLRFADSSFDEGAQQRRMASILATDHHEVVVDDAALTGALEEVVWHCETPLMRLGPVPMFLLSGLVRSSGIKVVLTGEGADEFLGGYHIFRENAARRFWARQPDSAWRSMLLASVHPYIGNSEQARTMWAQFFRRNLTATDDPFYSHAIRWENSAWTTRLLAPGVRAALDLDRVRGQLRETLPPGWEDAGSLGKAQAIEIATFMSSYLLSSQGDRVALGHGVEPRFPFLDSELIEWSLSLPRRHKLAGMRDKVVLRRLASRTLPAEVWQRPKWPYRAPIRSALLGPAYLDRVRELLDPRIMSRAGLADTSAVSALLARACAGRALSEREEMGLVGIVTLHLLASQFGGEFASRVRSGEAELRAEIPTVLEDRRSGSVRRSSVERS